ncbi:MAG: autotransporter outer membrane beta-barrel domain-containing protein [Zoogloeaceae bacterium]|nr:autotransporter outer membrane beta-barrel domain-containing protein [Zoogloeaceae bacterium]
MNRQYRTIFNRSRGVWQVVSELAKASGKAGQSTLSATIVCGTLFLSASHSVYAGTGDAPTGAFADSGSSGNASLPAYSSAIANGGILQALTGGILTVTESNVTVGNTSTGSNAIGVYAIGLGSKVILNNATINTAAGGWMTMDDAIRAAGGGAVTVNGNLNLSTTGQQAAGIRATGAGSTVDVSGSVNVTGTGNAATGLWAQSGGKITAGQVDIKINSSGGQYGYGLLAENANSVITVAGGTIDINDTSGQSVSGIRALDGGVVNVTGALVINTKGALNILNPSAGTAERGVYVSGGGSANLKDITIRTAGPVSNGFEIGKTNADGTGPGAVHVDGAIDVAVTGWNSVALAFQAPTGATGSSVFETTSTSTTKLRAGAALPGAVIAYQEGDSAKAILHNVDIATTNANTTVIAVGQNFGAITPTAVLTTNAELNLINGTVTAGTGGALIDVRNGSDFTLNADNVTMTGMARKDATSESILNLTNNAVWKLAQTANSAAGRTGAFTTLNLASGATLDASAIDFTLNGDVNSSRGVINLAVSGATTPAERILTINGNYVGGADAANAGTLIVGTELGDDTSKTDKLVINGNVSGHTAVKVLHQGGTGALTTTGIKVIDVENGTNTGTFTLSPDTPGYGNYFGGVISPDGVFVDGAHVYRLLSHDANDGRDIEDVYLASLLFSSPRCLGCGDFRPATGSYLDNRYTTVRTQWHTLHDRQGQAPGGEAKPDANSWIRIQGSESSRDTGNFKNSDRQYIVHLGSDLARWNVGEGSLRLGLMGMMSRNNGHSTVQGFKSRHSVDGYSGGLYATWYGESEPTTGAYIDAWLLAGRFDNTVDEGRKEKYTAKAYAVSLEAGYGFTVHENKGDNFRLILQPQAQVISSSYRAGNHTEASGTVVRKLNENQITTRLGARLYADQRLSSGGRLRPFAEANWWHGQSSHDMTFNTEQVKDKLPGNIWELKLGLEGNATKNLSLWGALGAQGGRDYRNNTLYVGMKYAW